MWTTSTFFGISILKLIWDPESWIALMRWKQMQCSFYETLLGSQEFYVLKEGSYYTRGFTMGFIDTPTLVVDLFFILMSPRFYIEEVMYDNYKLLRFLFETYGWTLIPKNQSILFPKKCLKTSHFFSWWKNQPGHHNPSSSSLWHAVLSIVRAAKGNTHE